MRECGPLCNVSQFLPERVIGTISALVKSRKKAEANMFNKFFTLFCLRLLNDGTVMQPGEGLFDAEDVGDNPYGYSSENLESSNSGSVKGKGRKVSGQMRIKQARE